MGLWDKLLDRAGKKKAELEKKAMERAAEMALRKTKETAASALDSMGKTIENAIFGPDSESKSKKSEDEDEAPVSDDASHRERERERARTSETERVRTKSKAKSDLEAKPKEPLTRDYDTFVKDRAQKEADLERAVDDDLAALKKKLGKK